MGRIERTYPCRYIENRRTMTSRTIGNVRSDIVEDWDVPVEKQAKDAVPVQVGKPVLTDKIIKTYKIDSRNRLGDYEVYKNTYFDKDFNSNAIIYQDKSGFIRKSKQNGRWCIEELKYPQSAEYIRGCNGNPKISLSSNMFDEEILKCMKPKYRKHIMSIFNELYSKIAQLKIRV